MKFVLLGARVPLAIAPAACNCKGNPARSSSPQECPACPLTHLPKGVRMEPLQRNGPRLLPPGTQEVCSLCLWHQQGKLRSQSHWDRWLLLVLRRGVSVPVSDHPPAQNWFLWRLWHVWQAGAARPWIPQYSSIPSVTLERWHHEKNSNKTIFCCWLSVVPFHGFKIHLSERVQLRFVLFHHLNASSWSEEIKAI